ncbi:glycine zipper 2TM domain-containing protein [Shewanella maritima]|uniref:Glycine zipper 2TM domain-containing protein n=2 Tax=Shewanella maritima TaxID=2520507 RepID=A0A411PLZ3_9GAMM|nr:glycine zipper 2TM domain-containing protein [Shewanella maritima]
MLMLNISIKQIACLFGMIAALLSASFSVEANYQRNTAQQVEKVLYGNVESIKHITEKQLVEDRNNGWRTFGGALIGGLIGNQFGSGRGKDAATVLGALIGGRAANEYHKQPYYIEHKLIELMIKQEDGTQVMVIQDLDPGMPLAAGDEVRVVYLPGFVRVDIAM